jgi:hypothetical protein
VPLSVEGGSERNDPDDPNRFATLLTATSDERRQDGESKNKKTGHISLGLSNRQEVCPPPFRNRGASRRTPT